MKVIVSDARGIVLDWLVAKAEGWIDDPNSWLYRCSSSRGLRIYSPSTNWASGGPIIDREEIGIKLSNWFLEGGSANSKWAASYIKGVMTTGPTLLVAAMRCYAVHRLGDEVEVPEEICNAN